MVHQIVRLDIVDYTISAIFLDLNKKENDRKKNQDIK